MATTPASGGDAVVTVEPTDDRLSAVLHRSYIRQVQQRESSPSIVRAKLERLNMIVFFVAFLEWAGNAFGTLAFLWGTVVLLGGFCSLLSRVDFWFATVMIFMEGSRVFIRNDASVNQWLFGSTRAFRWENFSFPRMLLPPKVANLMAVCTGWGITVTPEFRPEIASGMLKVALLVIFSQLLTRQRLSRFASFVLVLLMITSYLGGMYGSFKTLIQIIKRFKHDIPSLLKHLGLNIAWFFGTVLLAWLAYRTVSRIPYMRKPIPLVCLKVIIASLLACLPFLQPKLASSYLDVSIAIAVVLLILSSQELDEEAARLAILFQFETQSQELEEGGSQDPGGSCGLFLQILETILPILFFWSVMFPLPGLSLKISFYMLFSVLTAVLIGNLQIPVAFLQVLLSILRLRNLLDHHHHHDYHPLPPDASPNFVPSIVVFFMLELCQGSSYMLAVIVGFISILCRRSLVHDLKFEEEWGSNAVNLYYRRAYQARTEKGLLPLEKSTPSLDSLSIESLGSTSSETQILGLRVLDNFLQRWDSKSKKMLIKEITFTSKKAVPALVDILSSSSTIAGESDIRLFAASVITEITSSIKISKFPGIVRLISLLLDYKNQQDSMLKNGQIFKFPGVVKLIYSLHVLDAKNGQDSLPNRVSASRLNSIRSGMEHTLSQRILFPLLGMSILQRLSCDPDNFKEIIEGATYITTKTIGLISYVTDQESSGGQQKKIVIRSSLNFVRWIASNSGKIGARFRRELSENPFLLNSLGHILDGDCQPELWEPVMDIIAALALDHEAARQEIGSTQSIISKLICAFVRQDDVNTREDNDHSLRMAAGKALANLTINSTDNCWAILLAEQGHNLIKKLIEMLDDEFYVCVAANLVYNLCANSRDKLMDIHLSGSVRLDSALQKAIQIIMTTEEGKKLEAALCITSQIGYVIPKCFRKVLISETDAAALVEKLVDTLNSNREPCPEYPRIRRVIVEAVISFVRLCPVPYRTIFREKKAKDALDMVKGTPSSLEKYRVFINGKGVLLESLPMRSLVDKAKKLIHRPTPTTTMNSEQGDHA